MKELPLISVVIATKDRASALRDISLPSLRGQAFGNFEVLVWDATEDLSGKEAFDVSVAGDARFSWRAAPRAGSASQRNDALEQVRAPLVLFVDDDTRLPRDALGRFVEAFSQDARLGGAGLVVVDREDADKAARRKGLGWILRCLFLLDAAGRKRRVLASGMNTMPVPDVPGEAEWLTGCCMAFRRSALGPRPFDEGLQRFGGYALGEDYDVSYAVYRAGHALRVIPGLPAIHVGAAGGRIPGPRRLAAGWYNRYRIWRRRKAPYLLWAVPAFMWSTLGEALDLLRLRIQGKIPPDHVNQAIRLFFKG